MEASSPRRVSEAVMVGMGRGVASTIYGTVVVMATLDAAYPAERDPWRLELLVMGTVFALWIAHLYAHALGESIAHRTRLTPAGVIGVARREFGILAAAIPPVAALTLGALGIVRENTAVWLALAIGFAALVTQGVRYARVIRPSRAGRIAVVACNVALGLLIVTLHELLVTH